MVYFIKYGKAKGGSYFMHFKKVLNHAPRKVAACLMVSALALGNTTPAIYATDMMSEEKMSEAETSIPSSEIGEDDKSQSQLENALIETDVTTKEIDTTNESSNTENKLKAVKDNNVYFIDKNASSLSTHNIVVALKEMAKAVYPEYYGDI